MDLKEFVYEIGGNVEKCFAEHETRHNTNRDEEDNVERVEENTPLLHRFPQAVSERSTLTTIIVSLLLIVLIAGVFIGIYLLVLQDESGECIIMYFISIKNITQQQTYCLRLIFPLCTLVIILSLDFYNYDIIKRNAYLTCIYITFTYSSLTYARSLIYLVLG